MAIWRPPRLDLTFDLAGVVVAMATPGAIMIMGNDPPESEPAIRRRGPSLSEINRQGTMANYIFMRFGIVVVVAFWSLFSASSLFGSCIFVDVVLFIHTHRHFFE